jgi:hypothetical protein
MQSWTRSDLQSTMLLYANYSKPSGKALVIHARDEPPFLLRRRRWEAEACTSH